MTGRVHMLPPFLSTRRLARGLGGLFFVTAALAWVAVGFDFGEMRVITRMMAGETIETGRRLSHALAGDILGGAQLVCLLATGACFLIWLHRARVNVRALGVRGLGYGREWTLLAFLVPGLNLVRPYTVISEIWRASDPATGDPYGWKTLDTPPMLTFWWSLFVAYVLLELAAIVLLGVATGLPRVRLGHGIAMAADMAGAVSASLAWFVVVGIADAQEEKHAAHGSGPAEPADTALPFDPRDALAGT